MQRYADISRVLKAVCDHHPRVKMYASGSSSLAINEQIQESLAGRKRIIHMCPLSFFEYLNFTEQYALVQQLDNLPNIQSDSLAKLVPDAFRALEQFFIYGGYPEVALTPLSQKREVLESIFDLYVKKDLVDFLNIERISHAKTLIHHLAVNHGQEAKYSQLAQVAGVDEKTAKNYLEILRETTADARNIKAAEMIYDEHFFELVRED
ncbi:MAG: AAA family ATPase [Desulfatiglandaceae bacterium]